MIIDPIRIDVAGLTAAYAPTALLLAKATIVLLAALLASRAMSRATAGARHLLWLVTIVTLLVMPAVATWAPLRMEVLPPHYAVTALDAGTRGSSAPEASGVRAEVATTGGITSGRAAPDAAADRSPSSPATSPSASASSAGVTGSALSRLAGLHPANASPATLLVVLWALVATFLVVRLAGAGLAVQRLVRRARALDGDDWQAPLMEVSDRLGLATMPRLLASHETAMPFACGLATPTIVLPADCESWSLDRRYAVLLHEVAHIERRDLVGHALGRVTCALYWFHPLVWSAAKHLRAESERACDDLALASGARASDYAEHLLDIIAAVRKDATPVIALAMARRKEFEGRMLAILDPDIRRARPNRAQSAALTVTVGVMALLVGAAAPAPRAAAPTAASATRLLEQEETARRAPELVQPPRRTWQNDRMRDEDKAKDKPDKYEAKAEKQTDKAFDRAFDKAFDKAFEKAFEKDAVGLEKAGKHEKYPKDKGDRENKFHAGAGPSDLVGQARDDERASLLARVLRSDTSASLRRLAAWGLEQYASESDAAAALADAARRDASARVREMAVWALGSSGRGGSAAQEALVTALRDRDPGIRATAAWALGSAGHRGAVDALADALSDTSRAVRMRALWAIGNTDPSRAPQQVISALRDSDANVRHMAAWVLFQIQDPAAVPALETALRNESNKSVQVGFLRALASTGERSVDAIRRLLESGDPEVRGMAVRALAGGQATGPWPWPWPEPRPYP